MSSSSDIAYQQHCVINIPKIDGDEELAYIKININDDSIDEDTIEIVIETYYSLIKPRNTPSNPENYYKLLSSSLGIAIKNIEKIFDIQFQFLKSKNLVHQKPY